MQNSNRWVVGVLIIAGLQLSACTTKQEIRAKIAPAKVEHIGKTGLNRLTLTAKAVERLDIKTVPVRDVEVARSGSGTPEKVVPYAAVLYDPQGETWVYTSPESQTYVRHRIKVDYIDKDQAVLLDGPPVGTQVVTVGATELFGTEFEIGH